MIDFTTIYIGVTLILLAILASLTSPFMRKLTVNNDEPENNEDDYEQQNAPDISIIIPVHNQTDAIKESLPAFLEQQYEAAFQVIVIAEKGDVETEKILKQIGNRPNLYVTYLPTSSRYMSKQKLAITIGVKASQSEWCVLTSASCLPTDKKWLKAISLAMNNGVEMAMGYTYFDEDEVSDFRQYIHFSVARCSFVHAHKSTPYTCPCPNLAFRKSVFMQNKGFAGNLQLVRGEFDFIINSFANRKNTATLLSPQTWLLDSDSSKKSWENNRVFYMESRKHLQRSTRNRWAFNIDNTLLHMSLWVNIGIGILSCYMQNWILSGASAFAFILLYLWRSITCHIALRNFRVQIPFWKLFPFQLFTVWDNLHYILKYRMADKNDFTSHKL